MPFFDRWHRIRVAFALFAAFAPAGCGTETGPFAHAPGEAPALVEALPDRGGIIVLGISGPPEPTARALQEAMIEALARHDIPAATSGGNLRSRFLQGRAKAEPRPGGMVRLALSWELTDTEGRPVGSQPMTREVPRTRWEQNDPALIEAIAAAAAAPIAALIQDPVPADAERTRRVPLHVWPVAGLPEIDALALRRAMESALRRRDYTVADALGDRTLVVAGSVTLGQPEGGSRRIEVVWAVLDGAGRELGRQAQDNMIPAGDGTPNLAETAHDIAEAAAGGVVELLERLPPATFRGSAQAG